MGRVFSLGQHTVHGIAACKDADKATVALGHEDCADASVPHGLASLSYRCARWKGDRVLVPHDIGHISHVSRPFLGNLSDVWDVSNFAEASGASATSIGSSSIRAA